MMPSFSTLYYRDSANNINSDYDSDSEYDDIDALAVVNHDIEPAKAKLLQDDCVNNETNSRKPLSLEIPSNLFDEFTSDSRQSHG